MKRLIPIAILVVLPVAALLGWQATKGGAKAAPDAPPFVVERVVGRQVMSGGHQLEPLPGNAAPGLAAADALKLVLGPGFPIGPTAKQWISSAPLLTIKLGVSNASPEVAAFKDPFSGKPLEDPLAGRTVYVMTGTNRVPCPPSRGAIGAIQGGGSAVPRANPVSPTVNPSQASNCEWALTIDANTGEYIVLSIGTEVFCHTKPSGPC